MSQGAKDVLGHGDERAPAGTLQAQLEAAVALIRARLPAGSLPTVGLILGSGLGGYADRLAGRISIPYGELPGFASSSVVGHAGNLVYGRAGGARTVEVLAMQGRVHFYEGHDLSTVVFPVRTLIAAGCRTLIITNAAGGVDPTLRPGELVVLSDHLNLLPASPLRGANDDAVGVRFPDMSDAYDLSLRQLAADAGAEMGLRLREGIYACLPGPAYETPAEVRMVRILGADLVGMSTVPEVIAARHMRARVLGISCVTNLAAGITKEKLDHSEVTATAAAVRETFTTLLDRILGRIASTEPA
ncbi:MAG TPA: purine-nucleoside phosphorylase [Polyangia bacterium]|jgi:purine-nucleoside phosphorylase|nr:purine-nucleoside phosphorylase [Polyangia bacterium]